MESVKVEIGPIAEDFAGKGLWYLGQDKTCLFLDRSCESRAFDDGRVHHEWKLGDDEDGREEK